MKIIPIAEAMKWDFSKREDRKRAIQAGLTVRDMEEIFNKQQQNEIVGVNWDSLELYWGKQYEVDYVHS